MLLLEKSTFPREKVCGDGLTPRAVKQLVGMGITLEPGDGWFPNKGIRIIGGGVRIELDWPELSSYPGFGLVRTRRGFDEIVARAAQRAGARLTRGRHRDRPGPRRGERPRIAGVTARDTAAPGDGERGRGAHLPGAAGGGGRRQLLPAVARHGPAQAGRPAAGGGDQDLLHQPPPRRRLPGDLARAVGRQRAAARLRVDLRRRRRHQQRGPGPAQHQRLLRPHRLPRDAAPLAGDDAGRVGLHRGEPGRPGPRRRAADGLQPHPALHQRPAAGGRRRRHGQPVQRRGHLHRHGVRRDRRAGDRPGAGAAGPGQRGTGVAGLPAGAERRLRWLLHSRAQVRRGDRPSVVHEVRDPAWATTARRSCASL